MVPLGRRPVWIVLALVLLLAALLRFEHAREVARNDVFARSPAGDERTFSAWAARVAQGRDDAIPYQAPLYPTLLGGLARLVSSAPTRAGQDGVAVLGEEPLAWARVLGAILGLVAAGLSARLALEASGDRRAALVAFALCALAKPLIYYEATLLREAASAALLAALALAYARARGRGEALDHAALGLALGLGLVLRENFLAVAIVVGLERTHALSRSPSRAKLGAAALLALGTALPVLPFDVKVWRQGDGVHALPHWNPGCLVYLANRRDNASLGGYEKPPFVPRANPEGEVEGFRAEAERRLGRPVGCHETGAFFRQEALREIAADPSLFARRVAHRALRSLVPWEEAHQRDPDLDARGSWVLRAPIVGMGALLPLALAGILFAPWRPRREAATGTVTAAATIALVLGAWWASFLPGAFTTRYRVAAIPLVAVLAARGGLALAGFVRGRRIGRLAAVAGIFLLLDAFLPAIRAPHDIAEALRNRAFAEMDASDFHGAVSDLDEASRLRGDQSSELLLWLGQARLKAGSLRFARAAFGRAAELDPRSSLPLRWLGVAELALRRPGAAAAAIEAALALSASDADLARSLQEAREKARRGEDAPLPESERVASHAPLRER